MYKIQCLRWNNGIRISCLTNIIIYLGKNHKWILNLAGKKLRRGKKKKSWGGIRYLPSKYQSNLPQYLLVMWSTWKYRKYNVKTKKTVRMARTPHKYTVNTVLFFFFFFLLTTWVAMFSQNPSVAAAGMNAKLFSHKIAKSSRIQITSTSNHTVLG